MEDAADDDAADHKMMMFAEEGDAAQHTDDIDDGDRTRKSFL